MRLLLPLCAAVFSAQFHFQLHADQGVTVVPRENVNLNDVNFSGQATNGTGFTLNMLVSCFGTNLRSVPTPLSPNASVNAIASFKRSDGVPGTVIVTFPSPAFKQVAGQTGTAAYKQFNATELKQDPANFAPG